MSYIAVTITKCIAYSKVLSLFDLYVNYPVFKFHMMSVPIGMIISSYNKV